MRLILFLLIPIIAGCGLSGIRLDGSYEKDGEKFSGGTEWHFNNEKSKEANEPVFEKNGKEYRLIAKKDIATIVRYHGYTLSKPAVAKFTGKNLTDFDIIIKQLEAWLHNR